jgi:enamine deaminase RidA (YjgF/YER057c/UK114 family)
MRVEQELEKMGLTLPEVAASVGSFIPAVQSGNLLFVSGATGTRMYEHRGKLGTDVTIEQGYEGAKYAMLSCLAAARSVLGDLDRIERIVKVLGFVNAGEGFVDTPKVINGGSDLLIALYGENGQHARSAIGVAALPGNAPVEIEMVVQVREA